MAPKLKKSGVLWLSCDACSSVINAKDFDVHKTSCPPPASDYDHCYIKDKVLFSRLQDIDDLTTSTAPCLTALDRNCGQFVFLSLSALQLCSIPIGSQVRIACGDLTAFRRAWPSNEGSLTSVKVNLAELKFEWRVEGELGSVAVSSIGRPALIARRITYDIQSPRDECSSGNILTSTLRGHTNEKLLYQNMQLRVPFYGRLVALRLSRIETFNPRVESTLEESLDRLNLDWSDCYLTCDETEWISSTHSAASQESINPLPVVGGYCKLLKELELNIYVTLSSGTLNQDWSFYGVLLYGAYGVGKSLIAKFLASKSGCRTTEINGTELFSKYYGETEANLRAAFEEATREGRCLIVLDNVETLCPKVGTDQERRVSNTLVNLLDSLKGKQVVVIATSSSLNDIDPAVRRPGRLEFEVEIPVPTFEDRLHILESLIARGELPLTPELSVTLRAVAEASHGFVGADLASLVSRAAARASLEKRTSLTPDDLLLAQAQVKPSAMREVFVQIPNVSWDDIGGQEDLKLKLQQAVEWPLKFPESFERLGIKSPRGVLMYGPPGCSKTLAAKALATESNINFFPVKGSDIFSKWVGESERAIRDVFKRARAVAPAIVFLDELDALGGERGGGASSGSCAVHERVLSQLLTELDGVLPLDNVIVIAATNRPDRIDKALMRPGRLDRLIYVPLPSEASRKQIFQIKFGNMPVDVDVNVETLARATDGFSGAEIVNVCHDAAYAALEENVDVAVVSDRHFATALRHSYPRTPSSLLDIYSRYNAGRYNTNN